MPRAYYWGMCIAAVVVIGLGVMLGIRQLYPRAAAGNDKSAAFLQRHWRVPIPLQGAPPTTYSPLEASLYPQDCGVCHPQQYQDWQRSLHSRSMGPGVYGQILEMDAPSATLCATCHTPLSEQIPQLEHRGEHIRRIRRLMPSYSTPVWSVRGAMSGRTGASDRYVVQNCPPYPQERCYHTEDIPRAWPSSAPNSVKAVINSTRVILP